MTTQTSGLVVLILRAAKALFQLVYLPFQLLPTQNKAVFLSRQGDTPGLDFIMLGQKLQEHDDQIQTVFLCKKMPPRMLGKALYLWHLCQCLYHLATASLCITDSYSIPVSVLKHKKTLRIMQIWHALCAVKKFGHQTLDLSSGTPRAIAKVMEMHRNYDCVLAPSQAIADHFEQGFDVPQHKIHLLGMPRIDYILTPDADKMQALIAQYPALCQRPNILYAPTFRKGVPTDLSKLAEQFDFNSYNLVIKHHELDTAKLQHALPIRNQAITIQDGVFSLFDLYKLCDIMITDYSSAALEFSLLHKPIYFYLYDYDAYAKDPGLNIDIRCEFPAYSFESAADIIHSIRSDPYDLDVVRHFREKYITAPADLSCTDQIASLLLQQTTPRTTD